MLGKEVTLFFNFKGTIFSNIFDTSKTERARAFPPFSHMPHSKQDDVGKVRHYQELAPGGGCHIYVQLCKYICTTI